MCQFIWQIGAVNFDSSPLPSIRVVPVLPASVVECLRATFSFPHSLLPSGTQTFDAFDILFLRCLPSRLIAPLSISPPSLLLSLITNCSSGHLGSFSPLFIAFLLLSLFPNSLSLNSVNSVFLHNRFEKNCSYAPC